MEHELSYVMITFYSNYLALPPGLSDRAQALGDLFPFNDSFSATRGGKGKGRCIARALEGFDPVILCMHDLLDFFKTTSGDGSKAKHNGEQMGCLHPFSALSMYIRVASRPRRW